MRSVFAMQIVYRSRTDDARGCTARPPPARGRRSRSCAASRARIGVEDTSRRVRVDQKYECSARSRWRPAHADARLNAGIRAIASQRRAGPGDHDEVRGVEHGGKSRQVAISANASAPRMKKICDGCQPSACSAASVSIVYDGAGAPQLAVGRSHPRLAVDGERHHRKPVKARCLADRRTVRRIVDRDRRAPRPAAARVARPRAASRCP